MWCASKEVRIEKLYAFRSMCLIVWNYESEEIINQ